MTHAVADSPASDSAEDAVIPDRTLFEAAEDYYDRIFSGLPIFSVRLVRETVFTFSKRAQVRNPEEVYEILSRYYADKDREELVAVLLDTANTVIGLTVVSVGSLGASLVDPAQVFKPAILANAASVIVAHNHPSGHGEPSREDVAVTRKLTEAGDVLDVPVRDHLIVTEEGYTSLAERGLMK